MLKTYIKHNPESKRQGFKALKEYANDAILAAWDNCHKIYLAMDKGSADWFRQHYDTVEESSSADLLSTVNEWYSVSCSLRFIQAVFTVDGDPNEGFVEVVSQFAKYRMPPIPTGTETRRMR